jgi:hypothetical protein
VKPPPGSRSGLKLKYLLEPLKSTIYIIIVFQGGDDGRGYGIEIEGPLYVQNTPGAPLESK